ncbi:MAG: cupin domain-containing protein [Gemmatimonadota bacterium]
MSRDSLNTPVELIDLVRYQSGAVVSQALVKEKGGTVTAFAFDAGEGLSEHTAPFDALLLILDGWATVTVAGTAHSMHTGQIVRLPADIPHAVQADEPFKMLLVMMRP